MLKSFVTEYFGFNKQQRNGLAVLVFISGALLFVRIAYPFFIKPSDIEVKYLPLFPIDSVIKNSNSSGKDSSENKSNSYEDKKLFAFNPNVVNYNQLLQLGFKAKTAKTFIKFRNNGFVFKKKVDLKKVYGISKHFYTTLEPYILIDEKIEIKKQKKIVTTKTDEKIVAANKSITKVVIQKIEINSADTAQLLAIPDIDKSIADRILKYKLRLGGFVSLNQLIEIYGFDNALCSQLNNYFTVDSTEIQKINPNKESFSKLNKHPYITFEMAKGIVDWRKKTDLNASNFFSIFENEENLQKLKPYLKFD